MNVNEVVTNRATELLGGNFVADKLVAPNDDVNRSQSSNGTFPTAMHIATYVGTVERILRAVEAPRDTLAAKSAEFESIIDTGRTHVMDATPLTLGQEFSGHVAQLDHRAAAVKRSLAHVAEPALGGTAVGVGLNAPSRYAERVAEINAELKAHRFVTAPNKFEALSSHDSMVGASAALRQLAVSLFHIADNIRPLASGPRTAIGEILLPPNEPGSRIMPSKVNPTQCEALTQVCVQVIGNDAAVALARIQGQFQLNVFKPVIAHSVVTSIRLLSDACVSFDANCAAGIVADGERARHLVGNSLMLVTALNSHIGCYKAAEIAQNAHAESLTLRYTTLALGYLTASESDAIVDPSEMIGPTPLRSAVRR